MASARFSFLFLLLGQNGLHHVARLGHVGEINLGLNALRRPRSRCVSVAGSSAPTLKLRANFIRLVRLQRTGVGLAG
jgi:hypothetical protein